MSDYSFNDKDLDWNNPNKTKKQKELIKFRANLLNSRIKYPLDHKIDMAKRRIKFAIREHGEKNCYIGFSGGKDSTILSHLITKLGYRLDHVFSNTKLEYPECVRFAGEWCKKYDLNLHTVYPDVNPYDLFKKYGYPMFSKHIARLLYKLRNDIKISGSQASKIRKFLKYKDVPISEKCCDYLKKYPMKKWEKKSDKSVAFLGLRSDESHMRRGVWIRKGCIYTINNKTTVTPIVFFTDQDIWDYAKKFKIKFADIYYNGLKRNGCFCCGFGSHLAKDNNFQKLKRLNPILWKSIMDKWGFREICKRCNVKIE